jgi:hypothetical protein
MTVAMGHPLSVSPPLSGGGRYSFGFFFDGIFWVKLLQIVTLTTVLIVVHKVHDNECLHLRGDWTPFGRNKGVILGVAFPELGPRWTGLLEEYVPIPLE